jgi:quercetin dioxygenase-like cupin family protein
MIKTKHFKTIKIISASLALFLLGAAQYGFAEEGKGIGRSLLLEKKLTLPSANINSKVIRVVFPPMFKAPWHTHEGPGPRYIIKGSFEVSQHGKTVTYSAGDVFWETGELMSLRNVTGEPAELIIFEMAPLNQDK